MNRQLFELQELDNLIGRLTRDRSHLDDGSSLRSERDTLAKARDAEKGKLNTLNTQRMDKELQLKTTEEKIARQQQRLMNATSAHEVTSLERDITGLSHARGDLDEAILTLMDEADTTAKRLAELEREWHDKNVKTHRVEAEFNKDADRLDAQLAALRAQRQKLAGEIDADDLAQYNRFAKAHHGIALAHVENGLCSVCGTALTPFILREAKTQEWPQCESCRRLLYVE